MLLLEWNRAQAGLNHSTAMREGVCTHNSAYMLFEADVVKRVDGYISSKNFGNANVETGK
jgi:hypothetical protein